MSVSLFNAIPTGAIEVMTDATGEPHFKRADLGQFLDIKYAKDVIVISPQSCESS